MKHFSHSELKIIHFLSDKNCHSADQIANELNLSTQVVLNNLNQLVELGLAIEKLQQGYRLNKSTHLLDELLIQQYLERRNYNNPCDLHLFAEINSTNQFLKELSPSATLSICCSEKQTEGRGRFGRKWISPFGENIYFSMRRDFNCNLSDLSGLSLIVGLAIMATLRDSSIEDDILIKWPNDILWHHKKLCGILIELSKATSNCSQVIIGIGMNINMATQNEPLIGRPWCSLYEMTNTYYDRNKIVADLIFHLTRYIDKFQISGFVTFIDEWKNVDYLQGQPIKVSQAAGVISGKAYGISENGQLCLRDEKGLMHYLSSGDTSLCT